MARKYIQMGLYDEVLIKLTSAALEHDDMQIIFLDESMRE